MCRPGTSSRFNYIFNWMCDPMSLIPCTQNCKYQREGLCTLDQAPQSAMGQAVPNDACLNFTPRPSNQHSDGFTDVAHPDQI